MLDDISGAALTNWSQGAPIKVAYSWQRNASIADLAGVAYSTMAVRPDTIQKVWTINIDKPELWSTCTAGMSGGEGNWLNTSFAPGSAPNTGMYFQPKFDINLELGTNAATGTCGFTYEIEYLVEFRGSVV